MRFAIESSRSKKAMIKLMEMYKEEEK